MTTPARAIPRPRPLSLRCSVAFSHIPLSSLLVKIMALYENRTYKTNPFATLTLIHIARISRLRALVARSAARQVVDNTWMLPVSRFRIYGPQDLPRPARGRSCRTIVRTSGDRVGCLHALRPACGRPVPPMHGSNARLLARGGRRRNTIFDKPHCERWRCPSLRGALLCLLRGCLKTLAFVSSRRLKPAARRGYWERLLDSRKP